MSDRAIRLGGFIIPPSAWAVNTPLGQMLSPVDCATGAMSTAIVSGLLSLLVAAILLLAYRQHGVNGARTALFVSGLGMLSGLAFAFALLLQGAASLLLNPCAH